MAGLEDCVRAGDFLAGLLFRIGWCTFFLTSSGSSTHSQQCAHGKSFDAGDLALCTRRRLGAIRHVVVSADRAAWVRFATCSDLLSSLSGDDSSDELAFAVDLGGAFCFDHWGIFLF